jgi:hypothetical protein
MDSIDNVCDFSNQSNQRQVLDALSQDKAILVDISDPIKGDTGVLPVGGFHQKVVVLCEEKTLQYQRPVEQLRIRQFVGTVVEGR